jgi:hypothetical protein
MRSRMFDAGARSLAVIAVVTGGLPLACGGSGQSAGVVPPPQEAGSPMPDGGAGRDADAAIPAAFVRLAHWSPDAPPIDVCFAPQGAAWDGQTPRIGPLLAGADAGVVATDAEGPADAGSATSDAATDVDGATDAGGAAGLAFSQATAYLTLPPGAYSARLVTAGAADCETPLVSLDAVTLADGSYTTLAAVGLASPMMADQPLKLAAFGDDVTAPEGQIALRFINASPSASLASVAFGTGSLAGTNGPYASLFSTVQFASTSSAAATDAGSVDANGYLFTLPLAGATMSAHASALSDLVTATNDVTVGAGSAATLVLLGTMKSPELVLCDDAAPTGAVLATCSVVSP